jgi:hypothetical protein
LSSSAGSAVSRGTPRGLSAWDAWAFWVPKAKAIYYFGGLDEQFFRELVNPTYPTLLPALEASSFGAMGSADVVTLHLQFWFLACGFVASVAGLLAPRVPALLLWPFLLLVLVAPRIVGRSLDPQADFLLDYLFALAALLIALWLAERQPWQLVSATLFLGAAMLTKRRASSSRLCHRRGVGCVLEGAPVCVAAPRWQRCVERRRHPWHIWFSSRASVVSFQRGISGPVRPSRSRVAGFLVVLTAVGDYDLWLVVPPLAAAGIVLAFIGGARMLPVYALLLYGLLIAGFTWVLWSFIELQLPFVQDEGVNPIVRLAGSLVILSGALLPLLFTAAWRGSDGRLRELTCEESLWAIVLVVALAYPLSVLARGTPHFPSREECVHPATEDGDIAAVFGYFDSEHDADVMRDRALSAGFKGPRPRRRLWPRPGCGRWDPVSRRGASTRGEAQSVGLHVTLEQAG